jgi:hypothetical protein
MIDRVRHRSKPPRNACADCISVPIVIATAPTTAMAARRNITIVFVRIVPVMRMQADKYFEDTVPQCGTIPDVGHPILF